MPCRMMQWGAVLVVSSAVTLAVPFAGIFPLHRAIAADLAQQAGAGAPPAADVATEPPRTGLEPGGPLHDPIAALARVLAAPSAPNGLLSLTTNTLGMTIARYVQRSGGIVELTFDARGALVAQRAVGSALALPVVSRTFVSTVDLARVVRDPSGSLIQIVTDPVDRVLSVGIVRPQAATAAATISTGALP